MTTIASPSTDYRRARSVGSAALLTAAVASTLLTISTPGTAHAAPASAGCPTAEVVMMTGTFETDSGADSSVATGLLKQVTDPLVQQFGSSIKVTYPA